MLSHDNTSLHIDENLCCHQRKIVGQTKRGWAPSGEYGPMARQEGDLYNLLSQHVLEVINPLIKTLAGGRRKRQDLQAGFEQLRLFDGFFH
jgi:hypothetical protein